MCGLHWAGFSCGFTGLWFLAVVFGVLAFLGGSLWQKQKECSKGPCEDKKD